MIRTPSRNARPILGAVVGVLCAALVVGLSVVLVQVFALTSAIREQQKANTATNERIVSCTDPQGECYREAQERTADAVADIGKVAAYASSCADRPGVQGEVEVYACVLDRLEKDDAARSK